MEQEEWRVIPNDVYPELQELYAVSSYGRVKRIDTGHIMSLRNVVKRDRKNVQGYLRVELHTPYLKSIGKYKGRKKYFVHRLVASAFINNKDSSKTELHHIDNDKHNNHVDNLMWVSPAEHAHIEKDKRQKAVDNYHKTHVGEASNKMKKMWKEGKLVNRLQSVYGVDNEGVVRFAYTKMADAERDGFNPEGISQNICGRSASSGGIRWFKATGWHDTDIE